MRNADGLTHKEWIFCEALLRNGMKVEYAYKEAYRNDKCGRNGHRLLKRKEVVAYLHKRLQEKQNTFDVLLDKAHKRLAIILETGDDKDAVKAIEIVKDTESRLKELETKAKVLEATKEVTSGSIQITFSEAQPKKE